MTLFRSHVPRLADTIGEEKEMVLRRKLHSLRTDCGCAVGTLALLLSMAMYVRYFFYSHGDLYGSKDKIVAGIVVFFGSATLGKGIGLLLARLRLRLLQRSIS